MAFSIAEPRLVGPSKNVTVPVGVPVPGGSKRIAAVSVTGWRHGTELAEVVSVVAVAALRIVTVRVDDTLSRKLASLPYRAVIECGPSVIALVVSVATPSGSTGAAPSGVAPSKNVMLPVGLPVPGGTTLSVARRVTG